MTNNQLTDAQISNATLIRLIRWADEHKSHYVAAALRELQERRKADREPVILYRQVNPVNGMKTYWAELDPEEFRHLKQHTDENAEFMTLYRHAQQPVVPDDVLDALQKVARLRLDLNDFDGDRRGIADCLGDAEEALIEVVNRRAAMLSGGKP